MALTNYYVCTHTDTHIPHSHAPKRHYTAINSVFYEGAIILYFRALKNSKIALHIDLSFLYRQQRSLYFRQAKNSIE